MVILKIADSEFADRRFADSRFTDRMSRSKTAENLSIAACSLAGER
jgi:hypothetical protein